MQVHWARHLFLLEGYSLRGLIEKLTFRQRPWGKWIWSEYLRTLTRNSRLHGQKKKKNPHWKVINPGSLEPENAFPFFLFKLSSYSFCPIPGITWGQPPLTGTGWWNPENSECDLGVWHSQIVRKSIQELNRWEWVLASGMLLPHFYWHSLWFTDLIQF